MQAAFFVGCRLRLAMFLPGFRHHIASHNKHNPVISQTLVCRIILSVLD